jgi:hypothetical protein
MYVLCVRMYECMYVYICMYACMYVLPLTLRSPLGQQPFTGPLVPIGSLTARAPNPFLSTLRTVFPPPRFTRTMKTEAGSSSETLVPT